MELKDFLEMGAQKAGSLTALGKLLDLTQPQISNIKAYKRPLPTFAAMKLADYIGIEYKAISAANELISEKDEAKRSFYRPFVEHARAASIAAALTIALVLNLLTPTPAEAAPRLKSRAGTICIMLSSRPILRTAIVAKLEPKPATHLVSKISFGQLALACKWLAGCS